MVGPLGEVGGRVEVGGGLLGCWRGSGEMEISVVVGDDGRLQRSCEM